MKKFNALLIIGLALAASSARVHSADQTSGAPPLTALAAADFAIVPGQSIGKIRLGDSPEKVHQTLGARATWMLNGPLGSHVETYRSGFTIAYRNYKVVGIEITSKQYKAPEGVCVGSSPEAVRKLFKGGVLSPNKMHLADAQGKPTKTVTFYIYTDARRGIQFQFGNNVKNTTTWCDTITVMKPTP